MSALANRGVAGPFFRVHPPLGFMLSFRTHGTWFHGDERGFVDDDHNTYGTPHLLPDTPRAAWAASAMRFPRITLDPTRPRQFDGPKRLGKSAFVRVRRNSKRDTWKEPVRLAREVRIMRVRMRQL